MAVQRFGRLALIALLMVPLCLAVACTSKETTELELTETDNGTSVTVKKGQLIAIGLLSQPTRGARWDVADMAILDTFPLGREQFRPDSKVKGFDGVQVMRFQTKKAGTFDLNLIYHVVGSKEPPISTYTVKVTVQ